MGMNYKRGKQLVIFDSRVRQEIFGRPLDLEPPEALYKIKINPADSIDEFLDVAAMVIEENEGKDAKIDAIHLIAHGSKGFLQLGKEGLSAANAKMCEKIQNKARVVVLNACSAGADLTPGLINAHLSTLGGAVANKTNSKTIVCRDIQQFEMEVKTSWLLPNIVPARFIYDPGDFEGTVYICYPDGTTNTIFAPPAPAKSNIDVEGYIFVGR
jgi:hypothetical protein